MSDTKESFLRAYKTTHRFQKPDPPPDIEPWDKREVDGAHPRIDTVQVVLSSVRASVVAAELVERLVAYFRSKGIGKAEIAAHMVLGGEPWYPRNGRFDAVSSRVLSPAELERISLWGSAWLRTDRYKRACEALGVAVEDHSLGIPLQMPEPHRHGKGAPVALAVPTRLVSHTGEVYDPAREPFVALRLSNLHYKNLNMRGVHADSGAWSNVRFRDSDLAGFGLSGGRLEKCVFTDCDFEMASLSEAEIRDTEFVRCNLSGAFVFSSNLVNVRFVDCELGGASFSTGHLENVSFEGTSPPRSFEQSTLESVRFTGPYEFWFPEFSWAKLRGINFSGLDLAAAKFRGAKIERCQFGGCNMENADIEDVDPRAFRGAINVPSSHSGGNEESYEDDIFTGDEMIDDAIRHHYEWD